MADVTQEAVAKAIALEAGAVWPQDAARYRRLAAAALTTTQAEVEALRAEVERLREALREIADYTEQHGGAAKALRIIREALSEPMP